MHLDVNSSSDTTHCSQNITDADTMEIYIYKIAFKSVGLLHTQNTTHPIPPSSMTLLQMVLLVMAPRHGPTRPIHSFRNTINPNELKFIRKKINNNKIVINRLPAFPIRNNASAHRVRLA